MSPSPSRYAGASPCPVSPSHFLSRPPPLSRRAAGARARAEPPLPRLQPPQPAAPGEGKSGRARPRPAPRPSPARRGRTGKMNNGSKAEKENTPNEANLQEEEVRSGSVRWRVGPGTVAAGFLQSAGGRAAGGARVPGRRAAPGRERRGRGFGNRPGPETPPQTVAPGGCIIGECVFVGPRASACLKLRNFEDFAKTFVSIMLSFVCPGF
ncbi:hypothetical protein J1605_010219 [Eschrichtius robustus]|uniref:Uncharacterized protein n=1 Tax=Eschrichtius robustus TaxID=9764 RepID=A0AB34GUB6_ESCRO|nr:hypothetical protein J1605_010219 [Eschrichtius robustus]